MVEDDCIVDYNIVIIVLIKILTICLIIQRII
jgi:hypothetical protein